MLSTYFRKCIKIVYVCLLYVCLCCSFTFADTINIVNNVHTYTSLTGDTVNMSGVSELHVTSASTPLTGCIINLNSEDSFLFLENIKPSNVNTAYYLNQIKVNGANAALNINIRIVEYAAGVVIIPQSSTFQPLQVFTGENFQGNSAYLSQYTEYNATSLGTMTNNIRSFILKRGYTATFSNSNGGGYSKNYVAQDCDLEIGVLPTKFNNQINYVRIFPWRWISKKGIAGNIGSNLNIKWWYNWNIDQNSTLDKEYVPIRQSRWWPSLTQNWQTRGASHLLGYNEPDRPDQANLLVGDAIWSWGDLLWPGLRLGSPATSDGGLGWLYDFMDRVIAHDIRVDYVAVHYYRCTGGNDPAGAASQLYNYLKAVHDRYGLPIWITEWNNGANWTGCGDPTYEQQAACIDAMIDMLDSTPWVERYAIYNWVEDVRRVEWDNGSLTNAGIVYRDQVSPIGYQQKVPDSSKSSNAVYNFNDNFRDHSGNGNHPLMYGAPKRITGRNGNALNLDGTYDYLKLPTNIGEDADFTFAAWVYWNGGGNWQRIFDFGNNTTQNMFLTPASASNTLRFAITTSGGGSNEQRVETTGLTIGQWVHVAVTLNGNIGTMYVNGSPVATNTSMTIDPSHFQPTVNYLGKSQYSADPLFNGMLDDVVITDYAMSTDQIAELVSMNQPLQFIQAPYSITGVLAGAEQVYDIYDADNGSIHNAAIDSYDRNLKTYWANDGTVPTAWIQYDLGSVTEVDRIKLKLYNGATRTYPLRIEIDGIPVFNGNTSTTTGYWEPSFTPASGRYVKVTMTDINSDGGRWLGIWEVQIVPPRNEKPTFNAAAFDELNGLELSDYTSTLVDDVSDPESDPLTFSKDSGADWLTVSQDGSLSGMPTDSDVGSNVFTVRVTDNAGLYDSAQMTIQVDNIYSGVRGLEDLVGLTPQWLQTGCTDTPSCGGADLDGDFNVTLSDISILFYNWLGDDTLQLLLKLDEVDGDTAADNSIYARPGFLINDPTWSSGYDGNGLDFDGVDDAVQIPGYKGVTGTTPRTCAFWIKTTSTRVDILGWGRLFDNDQQTVTGQKWQVVFYNEEVGALVQGGNAFCAAGEVNDGQWHHVAVVLEDVNDDGILNINETQFYIDGFLREQSRAASFAVGTGASNDVYIGKYPEGSTYLLDGSLDEVRIYNRALTEQEVQLISSP